MTMSEATALIVAGEATHARRQGCPNLVIWSDAAGWLELEFGCSLSVADVAAADWVVSKGPFR